MANTDIHYIEVDDVPHIRELMNYNLINPATVCFARDGSLIYISSDGSLIPITGESKNNIKIVSSEADMLKLANISRGQMVLRTDQERLYILMGEDPGEKSAWITEKNLPIQWGTIKEVLNNG